MLTLSNDVRYAIRLILKNRVSSLFIALVLAIGIGANTAVFSMVDAIVRRPFPFQDIQRIVTLSETYTKAGARRYAVSPANFLDWRNESNAFERVVAYKESGAILIGRDSKEQVDVSLVTPGFFEIFGLAPYAGRYHSQREDDRDRNAVVLSYRFWKHRMGADPAVIGKKINLDGIDYDVIGVGPSTLDFPIYTEVWMPLIFSPSDQTDRSRRDLSVIAKLKTSHSIPDARSEMSRIGLRLAQQYPVSNADTTVAVFSLIESFNSYSRSFVLMLMGAVAFVLLLACANVANLQLARIIMRRKEIAIRISLGASRTQIMRQLLVEGLILSLLGAAPGVVIGTEMLAYIKQNMTEAVVRNIAGFSNVGVDARVLVFTLLASILSAVLFVLPAIHQALQGRSFEMLKEEGRGSSPSRSGRRLRSVLVVSEVMLAVLLVVGATLMIGAFNRITNGNRGYDPVGVHFFNLDLSSSRYKDPARIQDLYKRVLAQVGRIPGVQSVGTVSVLPSVGDSQSSQVATEESDARPGGSGPSVEVRVVSEDYFRTMSIPLKAGRAFTAHDNANGQPVAIVSESAAQVFWPGRSPLGHSVKLLSGGFDMPWLNVVGVVGDVNYFFLNSEIRPTIYISYQQGPAKPMLIVGHTSLSVGGLANAVRAAVQQADSTQDVYRVTSMLALLDDMAGGVKIVATLMQGLGLLALLLCVSGVYAVVSCSVAQQSREIGVRVALGAQKADVFKLVLRFALRLVGIGLALGVPVAVILGYLLSNALEGVVVVRMLDFLWLILLMLLLGAIASYVPARRAVHISPISALRG
jgi:putative ABC transport system permease protein